MRTLESSQMLHMYYGVDVSIFQSNDSRLLLNMYRKLSGDLKVSSSANGIELCIQYSFNLESKCIDFAHLS